MAIRIELPEGFRHYEVAEWLNEYVGPIEEEVTWFWSHGEITMVESKYYPGVMDTHVAPEGVMIWKEGICQTLAAIRWS